MKIQYPYNVTILPGTLTYMGDFFYILLVSISSAAREEQKKIKQELQALTPERRIHTPKLTPETYYNGCKLVSCSP
jgi:hypothetical protein